MLSKCHFELDVEFVYCFLFLLDFMKVRGCDKIL